MKLMYKQGEFSNGLRFISMHKGDSESGSYDYLFGKFDIEIRRDINKAITFIKRKQ